MKALFLKQLAIIKKFSLSLCCLGIVLCTSLSLPDSFLLSTAYAQDNSQALDVENLLKNMSKAIRNKNYQGRFMYVVGNETSSFKVQHAVINGKEHERLAFLNKKQQEIVRVGHDLFCIHPGNHMLRQHQKISANPFSDKLSKIKKGLYENYKLSIEDNTMVAGRDTFKVSFKSKDYNRYDHHLWIDKASYVLLKANVSDPMLGALESFEYVQVSIGGKISPKVFEHKDFFRHSPKHFEPLKFEKIISDSEAQVHSQEGESASSSKLGPKWSTSWLPEGFYFSGESQQNLKSNTAQISESKITSSVITMLMYTDGIAAITVFIEPVSNASQFSESSQMGALSAFSHAITVNKQDFMITAVGEVQLRTVERVAKGLNLVTKP